MNEILRQRVEGFGNILDQLPEVKYAGDPTLRQVADEVSLEEGIEIGNRLGDVLIRYRKLVGYGRGLAAPQIGEAKRVFVTFVDDRLEIIINPKIKSN